MVEKNIKLKYEIEDLQIGICIKTSKGLTSFIYRQVKLAIYHRICYSNLDNEILMCGILNVENI